ncbi:hypothetical protein HOLleu_39373 [Holothuria leucospilota]|uniref:Reverse transcriptase domain-containing protein n=1 Tax=Holothuria leucospilota TaxID=206669 RepID=A0A9Q1BET9_HOLLE|nr:hypothetical protein HOLleu_39373 [Holothuria leucospilota]
MFSMVSVLVYQRKMALVDAVDKTDEALGKNPTSVGIFLDLSQAFDTTDHDILISKLSHYGIRGTSLSLSHGFTGNKQFTIFIGKTLNPLILNVEYLRFQSLAHCYLFYM